MSHYHQGYSGKPNRRNVRGAFVYPSRFGLSLEYFKMKRLSAVLLPPVLLVVAAAVIAGGVFVLP